jgi:hypothetical protein
VRHRYRLARPRHARPAAIQAADTRLNGRSHDQPQVRPAFSHKKQTSNRPDPAPGSGRPKHATGPIRHRAYINGHESVSPSLGLAVEVPRLSGTAKVGPCAGRPCSR